MAISRNDNYRIDVVNETIWKMKCKYYRRCRELEITNADYCPKVPEDCDIYSLMEIDGTLGFKVARLDTEHRDTPEFWMNVTYEKRGQRNEGREGFR